MAYFTREWLLLTHTSDATKLAFEVLIEDYMGDESGFPKQADRGLAGKLLLVKSGKEVRQFTGLVVLDANITGTVVYDTVTYTKGTPAQLKACYTVADLKVKSFDDAAFWDGEIMSPYTPAVVYGPRGDARITNMLIVERNP